MPTLTVGDHHVSYEDYGGAGPLVLLVHGSPGNGRAWQRVAERLTDRHRVVAPDLPGHGATPAPGASGTSGVVHGATLIEALVGELGVPAVLAAHSYGGVVALRVALRGHVAPGALALLEPVAVSMLRTVADHDAYAHVTAVFEDYIAGVEGGDSSRVRTMVDFWFGAEAFERLPPPLQAYMVREARVNVRDVRATFGEEYPPAALAGLGMPVTTLVGGESPDVTKRIAQAITAHVPRGSMVTVPEATHAMTTTHAAAVAEVLGGLVPGRP